uniref:PDZ domain-containing protein n=1 Tax=Chelydra serpentina TaxID=8475 RepID=A0A8C3TJ07_CHESE
MAGGGYPSSLISLHWQPGYHVALTGSVLPTDTEEGQPHCMDPVSKEILTSLSHTLTIFLFSPLHLSFFFLPLSLSLGPSPTRAGQFLSEVDTGLPADRAGMRDGDRLLAVNGEGVEGLCHQEVVDMIRAGGNQVTLLVLDPDGDEFYSSVCPGRITVQCEGMLSSACLVFQMGLSPLLFCEDGHPSSGTHTAPGSHPSMPQGNGTPISTPRLCHLDMGPEGYGFQLQTVTDKPGVFITQVTPLDAPRLSAKGGPNDPGQPQTHTHGA